MFVRRMKNIAEAGTVVEIVKVERNCLHLSNGKLLRLPGAADYIAVGERRPMELRQGDVIQFQVNLREQKIFNGNLARITGTPGMVELLNQDMNPVADGLRCLPSDFAGYDYGWVTTSHKSQGRTARHVVIAAQKLDRKAFYVSCSRGRRSLALFCPDKAHLKNQLVRSDDFRRNAADLLPPAPKKDYLTSSGNRIREWKEKYSMEKNAYERDLAAYREHRNELRQKLKPLQAESALLEKEIDRAHVESKVYERYKTLPWYKRLKQHLTGTVPPLPKHPEKTSIRMRELEQLKEELQVQIDGLKAPCPPSEHRFPLIFGNRIAVWFKRQNRSEKPKNSAPVRKLCEFLHAPSEKTFAAWLSLRKPNWHWQVFEQVFAEKFEKIPMEAFCRIPQTPSQYHVFRREENELLKMLEPVYHKNVVQEYRRERIELEKRETMRLREQHEEQERMERMKREEALRREREDRLKWEADALAEERRRNPISDAQRHVLEDLHKEGRLERMPSELSMREASALMANIFTDDPLNPMQKSESAQTYSQRQSARYAGLRNQRTHAERLYAADPAGMAKTRPELCSGKSPHTGKDTRNGALTDRIQICLVIPFDRGIRESGAITGVFAVQWMRGDEIPFCRGLCGFRAIPQTQIFLQIRFILGPHSTLRSRTASCRRRCWKRYFIAFFTTANPDFFPSGAMDGREPVQ